jgi:hypothetical protein
MPDPTPTADPEVTHVGVRPIAPAAGPDAPTGFELLGEIGRGGMGAVFRARERDLDREVAVKILLDRFPPDSPTARRFMDEARITGQLQHPGIPAVYRVGRLADGRPYLAMKLINGDTLAAMLRAGRTVDELAVIERIAEAVGYAHAHGVVHRDLKPANVMVGPFGEVQVMDWGLAKVLAGGGGQPGRPDDHPPEAARTTIRSLRDSDGSQTEAGSILGTPAYMAPEQAAGEVDRIGPAADVFGLGAILCALLTGRPPFDGENPDSVHMAAARGDTAAAFARLAACGADPDVLALCKRCLAFDPAARPADGQAVAAEVAALRRAADDRARQAERDRLAAEVRAGEQSKRRRVIQWAAAAVAAVLAAGTTVSLWQAKVARQSASDADAARLDADRKRGEAELARQAEADQRAKADAARAGAEAKEAEANAVLKFVEDRVFAAARPKGQDGGLGKDVSLRAAVTAALPALEAEFKDQPLVEARLRNALGATLHYLGDNRAAADQYSRARDLYAPRVAPDHVGALQAATGLANVYDRLNRPADALRLREEVADISRRAYPADHPYRLMSLHNLAVGYATLGRFADARPVGEEVLAARRRLLPPGHEDTLRSLITQIGILGSLDRHDDALALGREALDGARKALPPDHPLTLSVEHNIGVSYERLGRFADALPVFRRVLAARRRLLPATHPDVLKSLGSVATTLVALGRGAEALPLIDECVAGAAGQSVSPRLLPPVLTARLHHFRATGDPAGCRATADLWDKLNRTDADSLVVAARMRAVTAGAFAAADQPPDAAAEADRAMGRLTQAVAAGLRDRGRIEADADLAYLRHRADFHALVCPLPYIAPPPRPVW